MSSRIFSPLMPLDDRPPPPMPNSGRACEADRLEVLRPGLGNGNGNPAIAEPKVRGIKTKLDKL
jgi:hypothetical protein